MSYPTIAVIGLGYVGLPLGGPERPGSPYSCSPHRECLEKSIDDFTGTSAPMAALLM